MEQVEVTEHDREAFAATVEDMGLLSGLTASHIRQGLYDNDCRFIAKARVEATQAKDEEIARLREALDWAIAEIEGRTRYHPNDIYAAEDQQANALAKAREALGGSNE